MQTIKHQIHYITFILSTTFLALITSFFIFIIISAIGNNSTRLVSMQQLSAELTVNNTHISLSAKGQELLDFHHCFAFYINEEGQRVWDYNAPAEIPTTFSLQRINSMARWYLEDYPAYTWNLENGILVACDTRHSFIRYDLIMPLKQMQLLLFFMIPCSIFIFALICIVGTRWNHRQKKIQDQARTEWIAGVSHDIRTPLTTIIGYSEQFAASEFTSEEQKHQAEVIFNQSKQIRQLVEDFNLVNKLDYGILNCTKETVPLNALLRRVVSDLINADILTEDYPVELNVMEEIMIKGNELLLYRVFYNLLLNSIRHNPDGCEINIFVKHCSFHRVMITVSDTGQGYPDLILKNNRQITPTGSPHGLGLLVVSKIVQAHHGHLTLANDNGAAATVTLHANQILSLRDLN